MGASKVHWEVRKEWQPLFEVHGLNGLPELMAAPFAASLSKPGLPAWRSRQRFELIEGTGQRHFFYAKLYDRPPLREQIKRWCALAFLSGSGRAEWDWSIRLNALGIPAIEGIAYGQEFAGFLEKRSALVTLAVNGRSLEAIAATCRGPLKHSLVLKLADLAKSLHGRGYIHRDLYLCHIFCDDHDNLRLIDLARMIAPRWRRRRWWIKDLAALNYSAPIGFVRRTERWRFLLRYLSKDRLSRDDRRFARDIVARTRQMAAHDASKGRIQPWQRVWLTG